MEKKYHIGGSINLYKSSMFACAQRTGAAARESLRRAHVACAPRLRQRQSFSRTLSPAVTKNEVSSPLLDPVYRLLHLRLSFTCFSYTQKLHSGSEVHEASSSGLASQQPRVSELQAKLADAERRVLELRTQRSESTGSDKDTISSRALISSMREEVRAAAERLSALEDECRSLHEKAASASDAADAASTTAVALRNENALLRQRVKDSQDEETSLRARLLDSEAALLRLREELQRGQVCAPRVPILPNTSTFSFVLACVCMYHGVPKFWTN
jgi:hypothetical protein